MACTLFVASCSDDDELEKGNDPSAPDSELADYTVMMYVTGGGNLDPYFGENMFSADQALRSEKVNMRALVKWSEKWQDVEGFDGVRLMERVQEGVECEPLALPGVDYETEKIEVRTLNTFTNEQYSADAQYPMYKPANLAKYIDETVEKYPAKKYILILWNHGCVLNENDAPKNTRACLLDDNLENGEGMSVYELQEGIEMSKLAGGKLDMIYTDVCLMGNFETMYQLRNSTKYMVAAANLTPGEGGNYEFLLDRLATEPDLVSAMKTYVKLMPQFWREKGRMGCEDLALYDMEMLQYIIDPFKEVTARFFELYDGLTDEEKEQIDKIRAANNPMTVELYLQEKFGEEGIDMLEAADLLLDDANFYYYDVSPDSEEWLTEFLMELRAAYTTDLTASFQVINELFFDFDTELGEAIWDLTYTVKNATIENAENLSYPYNVLPMDNMQCLNFCWHNEETYTDEVAAAYAISDFDKETGWSSHFHKFKTPYTNEKIAEIAIMEGYDFSGDDDGDFDFDDESDYEE